MNTKPVGWIWDDLKIFQLGRDLIAALKARDWNAALTVAESIATSLGATQAVALVQKAIDLIKEVIAYIQSLLNGGKVMALPGDFDAGLSVCEAKLNGLEAKVKAKEPVEFDPLTIIGIIGLAFNFGPKIWEWLKERTKQEPVIVAG